MNAQGTWVRTGPHTAHGLGHPCAILTASFLLCVDQVLTQPQFLTNILVALPGRNWDVDLTDTAAWHLAMCDLNSVLGNQHTELHTVSVSLISILSSEYDAAFQFSGGPAQALS